MPASLAMLSSGPGSWPARILSIARWFVYCMTRAWTTRSASCWRTSGSLVRPNALAISIARVQQAGAAAAAAAGADRRPLVHQRREGDVPAVVDVAEAVRVGHPDVGEEDLVEAGPAGHLAQRADLDARRPHVDDEAGEALVLGQVGVGAGDDLADVAVLGTRRPHLLPVEDPLLAVALGAGLQAGEVAPGARLGEQLAADDVAAVHRLEVGVLGDVGAVGEDRRGDHARGRS